MSGVERTRIDTECNFLDVLDKVHEISVETVDPTHVFTLSQDRTSNDIARPGSLQSGVSFLQSPALGLFQDRNSDRVLRISNSIVSLADA